MTLEENIIFLNEDETLNQKSLSRKELKTIRLRNALLKQPNVPKLKSDSLIDLNDTEKIEDNIQVNSTDQWFANKVLPLKARNCQTKQKLKTGNHHTTGQDIKKKLEEALSLRRKHELEQRIHFYNADNENFSENDDEEEAEISDEEDENESNQDDVNLPDDNLNEENEDENYVDEEDDEKSIANELFDDLACEDKHTEEYFPLINNDDDVETQKSDRFSQVYRIGTMQNINDSIDFDLKIPDNYSQDDEDLIISEQQIPDLGLTQSNNDININSEIEMNELVMLCSGNFAQSCDTEIRELLVSPTFSSQTINDFQNNDLNSNEVLVVPETQDLLDSGKTFNLFQPLNILAYLDDEDSLQDFERVSDDDEIDSASRKRPINAIESDDEVTAVAPKRKLRFDDSDDEDGGESYQSAPTKAFDPLDGEERIFKTSNPITGLSLLQSNSELFTADYEDDMSVVDTALYDTELDEDGGYRRKFTTRLDDEESNKDDGDNANKIQDIFDDEAELSGDDFGSDIEGDDEELNEYEAEEGDNDQEIDQEELRNGIVKQYNKQTLDEEDRRLIQIQEVLFMDGDLQSNGNMDRSFRYRWRGNMDDIDWTKLTGGNPNMQELDNDEAEIDAEIRKRQSDMAIWKMEQDKEKESQTKSLLADELIDSPLFEIGKKLITNKKPIITTNSDKYLPRDSLLNKAASLRILLKENTNNEVRTTVAFRTKQ